MGLFGLGFDRIDKPDWTDRSDGSHGAEGRDRSQEGSDGSLSASAFSMKKWCQATGLASSSKKHFAKAAGPRSEHLQQNCSLLDSCDF